MTVNSGHSIWASLKLGLQAGALVGVCAALVFAVWDWVENPGGIFRGVEGTNWSFVWDTAVSWFMPVFLVVGAVCATLHIAWCVTRRGSPNS